MKAIVLNTFSIQAIAPSFNTSYLVALLKKHGINDVKQIDINQLVWNTFYSSDFISKLEYNAELSSKNINPYCRLTPKQFLSVKAHAISNIEDALRIMKGEEFYQFHKLIWAQKIFYDVSLLICHTSGTFFTSHLPYWAKVGFNVSDVEQIYEIAQNDKTNPLIGILNEKLIPLIIKENPSIILVDIMFPWDIIPALTLNILLKKGLPQIHINYAGQGFDEFCFSRIKEKLTNDIRFFFGFDSIFLYRNDNGIIDIFNNFDKQDFSSIENLAYIENNKIKLNTINNSSTLNHSIVSDYDDIDFKAYISPKPILIDRLSYRCFWGRCSYCSINSNKIYGTNIAIEHMINKIDKFEEMYGVKHFWFLDEGCTPESAVTFAKELIKNEKKIVWSLRTRIDENLTYERLDILRQSGLRELWIGLEHVNTRILTKMNKTTAPDRYPYIATRILQDASSIGIGLHFCHILGFPSETDSDRREIIEFYKKNYSHITKKPFFCTFNVFGLMKNSDMYRYPEKYGITSISDTPNGYHMISVPYKTTWNDQTCEQNNFANLQKWANKYTRTLVKTKILDYFWFTIADTPYELLLKEYYNHNPFLKKIKLKYTVFLGVFFVFAGKSKIADKVLYWVERRIFLQHK